MGTLTKGTIVLYPFPFSDLSQTKLRPCLVLSDEFQDDIILCQITSKRNKDNYCVTLLHPGLQITSFIRCNMLFTAEKYACKKILGAIDRQTHKEVRKKLEQLFN